MRFLTSALVVLLSGVVAASDMDLGAEFMGVLRPRTLTNLQSFTQALAGIAAPAITNSGDPSRPFQVDGQTFNDFQTAGTRSCNTQHNSCANAANKSNTDSLTVSQCDTQQTACMSAQASATNQNFQVLTSSDANFDYICDS